MIKIKDVSEIRALKAEKAGMVHAKEYLKMYKELKFLYGLVERMVKKVEYLEKKSEPDINSSVFLNEIKRDLQALL